MTRCPDECGKKWRVGKQMKPEWKKQEEKEEKKEIRKPTIKKEKTIARIMEEKEKEEKDLIELRATDKMVPRQFHKYLKVFEKKKLRKNANKKGLGSCYRSQRRICAKEEIYKAIKITTNVTGILCAKERWKEEDGTELLVFEQLDGQE